MKVNVPEGMLKAVIEHHPASGSLRDDPWMMNTDTLRVCLQAALGWLLDEIERLEFCSDDYRNFRNMFLAPEPESPYDALLDAALLAAPADADGVKLYTSQGTLLAEAYRRGREAEKKEETIERIRTQNHPSSESAK